MDALENNCVCHIEVTEKQDQPPQELEKEKIG